MNRIPTYEELEQKVKELRINAAGQEERDKKINHLNLVLAAIRNVNQLLIKEKDRNRLLQGVCDNLIKNRGYYNAWIVLLDESGGVFAKAEAGLGQEFLTMVERLEAGQLTYCAQRALSDPVVVVTEDPLSTCEDCPLSIKYAGRGGMSVRVEHNEKVYGLLTVSVSNALVPDLEEKKLIEEVAGDIAFGLHTMDLEEERDRTNEVIKQAVYDLRERNKELNCLFSISSLVDEQDNSLEEILQGTVDLLPTAWQYPEIACARIIFEGIEFKTSNFEKTNWRQVSGISFRGEPKGTVEICYLEEKPRAEEGSFLKEERSLIDAIAERTGKVIERKRSEERLGESEGHFRTLVENSLVGISIFQDNQIVYQNPEMERLLGSLPRKFNLMGFENIHSEDVEKVKQFCERIISRKVQTQDINFKFYSEGPAVETSDIKWVYCRANSTEYWGKEATLISLIDITKTKKLEHLLSVQDKMSSLGLIAAGIAHEIRNPLSGINIYLNTLERIYDKDEGLDKVKQILGQLQSASNKIESVIRRVMDFSKPSEPKFVLTDLNQPIEEAIKLFSITLRKREIRIEKALTEDLPPCYADANLIEQVILNLINNAAEAMKNVDGNKRIEVSSSVENNHIVIKISDSGTGVSLENKEIIFDPFYTTKNGSTGIGLSIVHRIVTDHGGTLGVATSKWGGAEFVIEIPIEK
jgi:PAS domain S-box-containing protein